MTVYFFRDGLPVCRVCSCVSCACCVCDDVTGRRWCCKYYNHSPYLIFSLSCFLGRVSIAYHSCYTCVVKVGGCKIVFPQGAILSLRISLSSSFYKYRDKISHTDVVQQCIRASRALVWMCVAVMFNDFARPKAYASNKVPPNTSY